MDTQVGPDTAVKQAPEVQAAKPVKLARTYPKPTLLLVAVWVVLAIVGFAGGYYGYSKRYKKPSLNDKLVYSKIEADLAAKKAAELRTQQLAQITDYIKKAGTETSIDSKIMDYASAAFIAEDLKDSRAKSLANSALQNIASSKKLIYTNSALTTRLKKIAGVK